MNASPLSLTTINNLDFSSLPFWKENLLTLTFIFLVANTTHILCQSPTNLGYNIHIIYQSPANLGCNLQLTHISCNQYIVQWITKEWQAFIFLSFVNLTWYQSPTCYKQALHNMSNNLHHHSHFSLSLSLSLSLYHSCESWLMNFLHPLQIL